MKTAKEAIVQAADDGEILIVAYAAGSRPGQSRELMIESVSGDQFEAYETGARLRKKYKIDKVIWAQDSTGARFEGTASPPPPSAANEWRPVCGSLDQLAAAVGDELKAAGWTVSLTATELAAGNSFKNGKPKKTPCIAIRYFDRSVERTYVGGPESVEVPRALTGRERPWRVDSWRLREGKTFGQLYQAAEFFMQEVRSSSPDTAKGMFAGHAD